jgi:hypothetical protein
LQGATRLGNQVEQADREMTAAGVAKRERWEILDPVRALVDDPEFWQHQEEGLAVYAAPGHTEVIRLRYDAGEETTVSRHFRVRPLLQGIRGEDVFYLLALTENTVRFFEATAAGIVEMDLGPIPESESDALWFEQPESQLQMHRSGGEARGGFHGHGLGDELRKEALERYLRLVDKGIHERVGHTRRPLVLACVAYYEPIFRAVSSDPVIVDEIVEGSPERLLPEELHARAWPLIERQRVAGVAGSVDRFRELAGTGKTANGVEEVVGLAFQGRVDTLLVAEDAAERWGSFDEQEGRVELSDPRRPLDDDLIGLAVLDTLEHGGMVESIPGGDIEVGAVLRF